MTAPNAVLFEDLIDTIMLEEPEPSHEALVRWSTRFPEHREALASFFATWAVQDELPDDGVAIDEERVHQGVLKHALAILDRAAPAAAPENPFEKLDRAGFRELAGRLHANGLFMMRLRDRGIDEGTMTEGFKRRVAEELSVPPELLAAHFTAPAQLPRALWKSDERPRPMRKMSFEEAVRSSNLTPEQQEWLLSL